MPIQSYAPLTLITAGSYTSTQTGTGVDLSPYAATGDHNFKVVMDVGTVTGTNPTWDVKIQESDTLGSGYADITGATFTQVIATGTGAVEIHTRTSKRYIRAVCTIGGTSTPTFPCAVIAIVKERFT